MNTMEWLTAALVILTAVLALVTGVYAYITFRIQRANERVVDLMQQQHEASLRAYISVGLIQFPGNPIFFLRIRNTGKTPATNLKLSLDKPFWQFEGTDSEKELSMTSMFSETIHSLPPDAELLVHLNANTFLFRPKADREKSPLVFTITASYQASGKDRQERTTIDLQPFAQTHRPIDPMLKELESISEHLGEIQHAIQNLRTDQA